VGISSVRWAVPTTAQFETTSVSSGYVTLSAVGLRVGGPPLHLASVTYGVRWRTWRLSRLDRVSFFVLAGDVRRT
jgi:hypothetical protein